MKPVYLINLTLSVDDPAALWAAAAVVAMTAPGMTMDDVIDTIGVRDDPSIEDCIAMLAQPGRYEGCTVTAMDCVLVPDIAATGRSGGAEPAAPATAQRADWRAGPPASSARPSASR